MKWKYKVGDKIRIKKRNYDKENVAVGWVPAIDNYRDIFTVLECKIGMKLGDPIYKIKRDNGIYHFVVQEWQIRYAKREKLKN